MGVGAPYEWASVNRFVNRTAELKVLDDWFDDPHALPLAMFGRRRVGKSWLLRRFAHGRPAVVLVGERLTAGMQFDRFARQLAPLLGVTPRFDDLAELITVLLRLGRNEPITVVIDEFPYLLPTTHAEADRTLSRIQAVFEEELAGTSTKLILSGSVVSQMAGLFAEHGPLHGRLRGFELTPLAFDAAEPFLDGLSPDERMERYAICGGIPRYLDLLGRGPLGAALVSGALGPNTPLWNEGRSVVEQELRQPGAYFGILQMLSTGDKEMNELAQSLRTEANVVSKYLSTLVSMRLVTRRLPIGAAAGSRQGNWHLVDPFLQFWFRFVFPHQADLEAGLPGAHLFEEEIKPALSDHVAWHFEEWARSTVRRDGLATMVGAWVGAGDARSEASRSAFLRRDRRRRDDSRHGHRRRRSEVDEEAHEGCRARRPS